MTSDLARIHEGAIAVLLKSSAGKIEINKQAEVFFAEALPPRPSAQAGASKTSAASLDKSSKTPAKRPGIAQRKTAEEEFRKGGEHYARLLRNSHHLQRYLRHLTHEILLRQDLNENGSVAC